MIVRDKIRIGDLSSIILYHAGYYSARYGWNHEFEAYVAKPLAEQVIRNNPRERIWIAEDSGEFAGSIALSEVDAKTAQLRWFILKEEYRRQGMGKQFMEKLLNFAGCQGYRRIILWTAAELLEAISLYRKYGFRQTLETEHLIWGKIVRELKFEKVL